MSATIKQYSLGDLGQLADFIAKERTCSECFPEVDFRPRTAISWELNVGEKAELRVSFECGSGHRQQAFHSLHPEKRARRRGRPQEKES